MWSDRHNGLALRRLHAQGLNIAPILLINCVFINLVELQRELMSEELPVDVRSLWRIMDYILRTRPLRHLMASE